MRNMTLNEFLSQHLAKILGETLFMVGVTAIIATILGSILASILFFNFKSSRPINTYFYKVLNFIVNGFRSFPFAVLLFAIIPFTRSVMRLLTGVGTFMGTGAAIVPLTVAAIPFFAKVIEGALIEVDDDVIRAAESLGLSKVQILAKVIFKEALPSIITGLTLSIITLIGFSAIAVSVSAGGIGSFAMSYGLTRFDSNAMTFAVVTLIILVALIQGLGNFLYKLFK